MKGNNIFQTKDYISKFETNKENPTVWKLCCIDELAASSLDDDATEFEVDPTAPQNSKAKTVFYFNRKKLDLVRLGLKGFDDFIHPQTDEPIKFVTVATNRFGVSRNIVSDQVMKLIPGDVMTELAQEIDKMSKLSKEEIKN